MEAEITGKIREAIKKKLIEYDAFVDDELPEYIMVLVANKKTKEQMDDDLKLFLGKNTSAFTSWLQSMLKSAGNSRLHDEKSNNDKEVSGDSDTCDAADDTVVESHGPAEEDDILALNAQEQETDDFLEQEFGHDVKKKKKESTVEAGYRSGKMAVVNSGSSNNENRKENERVTAKELFIKQTSTVPTSKAPQTTKQAKLPPKSTVKTVSASVDVEMEDAEYDPLNPSLNMKSVASRVTASERKSSVPPSRQANKLLLLKAVDDANKSIMGKQNIEEIYKPTPIKVLVSDARRRRPLSSARYADCRASNLRGSGSFSDCEEYTPDTKATWHKHNSPLFADETLEEYVPETVSRKVVFNPTSTDGESVNRLPNDSVNGNKIEYTADKKPVSPHFVVTLDGVDSALKRKWSSMSDSDESDREDIENMDIQNSEESSETAAKRPKPAERCRYWPSCKNGDSCEFHHPTVPCKAFPNCKYGEKCFYVHPKCKFDSLCSRKDCLYTHTCKRDFAVSGAAPSTFTKSPRPIKYPRMPLSYVPPACKFFPNCTAYNCPFVHPKPCRYGTDCQSPTCAFVHPSFPAPSKLKWKAE